MSRQQQRQQQQQQPYHYSTGPSAGGLGGGGGGGGAGGRGLGVALVRGSDHNLNNIHASNAVSVVPDYPPPYARARPQSSGVASAGRGFADAANAAAPSATTTSTLASSLNSRRDCSPYYHPSSNGFSRTPFPSPQAPPPAAAAAAAAASEIRTDHLFAPRQSQEHHQSQRVGLHPAPSSFLTATPHPSPRFPPYSPSSAPQDQLEKLVAEAQGVVGGFAESDDPFDDAAQEITSDDSSIPDTTESRSESSALSREREGNMASTSIPEPTAPGMETRSAQPPPTTTTNPAPQRPNLRSSSIDSAISSVSAQTTASTASNNHNILSNMSSNSSVDVQSLIQAAGSAEELIRHMLKDKQTLTSQNSQLWRLVDKQRAMILGLNKDLERALKEKDRYRKKLKEHLGMMPPLPVGAPAPPRSHSESPAPSIDDARSHHDHPSGSPVDANGVTKNDYSLHDRLHPLSGDSSLSVAIAPYPVTPSSTGPRAMNTPREQMPSPCAHGPSESESTPMKRENPLEATAPDSRAALHTPEPKHEHRTTPPLEGDLESPQLQKSVKPSEPSPPVSPLEQPAPRLPIIQTERVERPQQPSPQPLTQARKLGISTSVPPVTGLGKSPLRKAPPAPLDFSPQTEKKVDDALKSRADMERDLGTGFATAGSENSWQATPDDKKGISEGQPQSVPPAESQLVSQAAPPPPNSTAQAAEPTALSSPRIKQQFAKAPLPSPGLPSSPRPSDRPLNSPKPRNSKIMDGVGLPGSPRPIPLGSPRASMPPQMSRPTEPSNLSHQKSVSLDQAPLLIQPAAIPSIDARIVSSRMRPARMSMISSKPKSLEDSVFALGVFSRADGKEILRVEKDVSSLVTLDAKLRKYINFNGKVPDRSVFSGQAPARVDARRTAVDEYFLSVLGATMDERAALALCEYFSSDVVERSPGVDESNSPKGVEGAMGRGAVKQGYLTKRGKNFGGWKERYFVLDGPILKYYDGPGGAHLGQIKLHNAQIGRQSSQKKEESTADEDSQFRHAFLVLEPKRKDSSTLVRHVLCAENDTERDEWVSALLEYVNRGDPPEEQKEARDAVLKKKNRHPKGKEGSDDSKASDDSSLRSLSYEETNQGPAPARGPTPEELNRQRISPSPSSMLSQPQQQYLAHSPIPDRGHPNKAISGPTGGSIIQDLTAWGAAKLSAQPTEKALKKRSIWGFRQRSSSDLSSQAQAQQAVSGHQQAAEKFPLPRAVFGAPLEEAVYLTKVAGEDSHLPAVVFRCIQYLEAKNASEEEGIFRLSGSNVVIKGLKERFNQESDFNLLANDEYYDVHAIAGLLKLYLRELPTSVLTSERREDFVKVTEMGDKSKKIAALNDLVHSLPIENFALLKALSGHLLNIVDNADINKMTIRNVGIVFSPTLNIPAQVFSMFLHEYRQIFFRDGEAPQTPTVTRPSIEQPSYPVQPPGTPRISQQPSLQPQMSAGYEPAYERQPVSPTPNSTPRYDGGSSLNAGLAVPGQDAKSAKSRRRESNMMFMMGGIGKNFSTPPPQSSASRMVMEDSVYE